MESAILSSRAYWPGQVYCDPCYFDAIQRNDDEMIQSQIAAIVDRKFVS